jgi:sugar phosphate isomerase/epimerase
MSSYSRREFVKVVAAGAPLATLIRTTPLRAAAGVTLGLTTYSFDRLARTPGEDNVDEVIRALKAAGIRTIELASVNFEPAPPDLGEFVHGGTPAYPSLIRRSPEQLAALRASARRSLRTWRSGADLSFFHDFRGQFAAAGIGIHAVAFDYTDAFTDEEIEITLEQAEALGVPVVSSPLTMAVASRLAPMMARHRLRVAIHNQVDGNAAGAIGTAQLAEALALSPSFALKLDIGNLTASNCDAVAELRTHHARVSHVLVQDRLRNGGAAQEFGKGDTPIAAVLADLKAFVPAIPALAQYGYSGVDSPIDEVTHCMEYMQRAS